MSSTENEQTAEPQNPALSTVNTHTHTHVTQLFHASLSTSHTCVAELGPCLHLTYHRVNRFGPVASSLKSVCQTHSLTRFLSFKTCICYSIVSSMNNSFYDGGLQRELYFCDRNKIPVVWGVVTDQRFRCRLSLDSSFCFKHLKYRCISHEMYNKLRSCRGIARRTTNTKYRT